MGYGIIDSKKLIVKFNKFFEEYKKKDIKKAINLDEHNIYISSEELLEFDYELLDALLDNPDEIITIAESTLKMFFENEFDGDNNKIQVRFISLPESEHLTLREIRTKHIGKLVRVRGLVQKKTKVLPRLKCIDYVCTNPSCSFSNDKIRVNQFEDKARTLKACPKCKSALEILNKELSDASKMTIEELRIDLPNTNVQPKNFKIFLEGDLNNTKLEEKINPGSEIEIIGIIKEIPLTTSQNSESVNYDLLINANNVRITEDNEEKIKVTKEDLSRWKELIKEGNWFKRLENNFATKIYGYESIKRALLLQEAGGSKIPGERYWINILLLGDPSVAKTKMIDESLKLSVRCAKAVGKGTSGVGLTASTTRDEFTGEWTLAAGVLPMAHGGKAAIDEMDKMRDDDTSSMHECLESGMITVNKANIKAKLLCETSLVAGANPKYGRFDINTDIIKQIDMPPALISRFDLLFVMKDKPDKDKDKLIANHLLKKYENNENNSELMFDEMEMKKFFSFIKRINPVLTDESRNLLVDYYVKVRNQDEEDDNVPELVPRQLEGLVRLAQAHAKIHLRKKVKVCDVEMAININNECLESLGRDPETGKLDNSRMQTGRTKMNKIQKCIFIKDMIDLLIKNNEESTEYNIYKKVQLNGIGEYELKELLEKMKTEGEVWKPRKGEWRVC